MESKKERCTTLLSKEAAYQKIGIPCGDHFKVRSCEARIDNRGVLLILDDDYHWLHSRYPYLQTEYVMEHKEEIELLDILDWHVDPYGDLPEIMEKYSKRFFEHRRDS